MRRPRSTAFLASRPGPDHHRRVRGVGAARDGRDRHRAARQREAVAVRADLDRRVVRPRAVLLEPLGVDLAELARDVPERDPVLGPARAGEARLDAAQVELQRLVEGRVGRLVDAEEALGLGVGLGQRDGLGRPAGQLHVPQRLVVDREHRRGGPELRRHVRDRGPVGEAQRRQAGAVQLDELADHAVRAQHLGDREHQVGGRRPGAQAPGQLQADDLRRRLRQRLAEQHGLGLDAADAEAQHADAVDHRGVRVGADQRVGEGHALAVDLSRDCTTGERYSRLTWWTIPVPGGTVRKSAKACWAQRRSM